jgi:ABC-2 type transport system ATP-binding protein
VSVLGESAADRSPARARGVGALTEDPAAYPHFSARRNLEIWARMLAVEPSRIDELVARVGLAGKDSKLVRRYSLGMRQRLGIAIALLARPELLILDEPTNGLDPAGIRDIRRLIGDLAATGTTIILASHLLAEIEQVCTEVAILKDGSVVASGAPATLMPAATLVVLIRTDDNQAALRALAGAPVEAVADGEYLRIQSPMSTRDLSATLFSLQIFPTEIREQSGSLESMYIASTEGTQ